jgi:hypothetical protein
MREPECCSSEEAQSALGISHVRIAFRSMNGHLKRCNVDGQDAGVTRASLEDEIAFWQHATRWQKLRRRIFDLPWP